MVEFFRKGEVGDWKNYFKEDNAKWTEWIRTGIAETGVQFKFE